MKLVIDIPSVTYEEVKWRGLYLCLRDADALVNSIKNGTPYEERPYGEWKGTYQRQLVFTRICTSCNTQSAVGHFCMWCGADMRKSDETE